MTENVKEFTFRYTSFYENDKDKKKKVDPEETLSSFFEEVCGRMPKIKTLKLISKYMTNWSFRETPAYITDCLSSMKELEIFECSAYLTSPAVIETLSKLPKLRAIKFVKSGNDSAGDPKGVLDFHPTISPQSFPALTCLSFSATFQDASKFLELEFAPHLSSLCIHSLRLETAEAMCTLLLVISQRRRMLKKLILSDDARQAKGPLRNSEGEAVDIVTLGTIMPLVDFPNLVDIEISYHRPFHLSNSDLYVFMERQPELESLRLCWDPCRMERSLLTVDVLQTIGNCCPKLHHLSLYIDTRSVRTLHASIPPSQTRFKSLQTISFGSSVLMKEDVLPLTTYLSKVLPKTHVVHISSGVYWLMP